MKSILEQFKVIALLTLAIICFGYFYNTYASKSTPITPPAIQPETIFYTHPNFAICSDKYSTIEFNKHLQAGETTLASAMLFDGNSGVGVCYQTKDISPKSKWRVLSTDGNLIQFRIENTDDSDKDIVAALMGDSLWADVGIISSITQADAKSEQDMPAKLADDAPDVQSLIIKEEALNDACRGGRKQSCDQRDVLIESLESQGWCFGNGSPDQAESDKVWQECGATQ